MEGEREEGEGSSGSIITPELLDKEIKALEYKIFSYQLTYSLIAVYVGTFRMYTIPLTIVLGARTSTNESYPVLKYVLAQVFITIPWFFKPVFGYLSDKIFPFKYRIKGYCWIILTINFVTMICLYFIRDGTLFQYVIISLLFSVVFLDTIAQGMTTITISMQKRLYNMRNPFRPSDANANERNSSGIMEAQPTEVVQLELSKNELNYMDNISLYLLVSYTFNYVWNFIGLYLYLNLLNKGQIPTVLDLNVVNIPIAISISFCIILLALTLFFEELKQTSWINKKQQKKNARWILRTVFYSRESALLVVALLFNINPLNYMYMMIISKFVEFKFGLFYTVSPILIAGGLVFILIFAIWSHTVWMTTFKYIAVIIAANILDMISIWMFSYSSENAEYGGSTLFYFYSTTSSFSCESIGAISKLLVIQKFLRRSPPGCEVFYINLLTAIVSAARGVGKMANNIENQLSRQFENPSIIRKHWYFYLIPFLLSLFVLLLRAWKLEHGQGSGLYDIQERDEAEQPEATMITKGKDTSTASPDYNTSSQFTNQR